jgi:carboxyl-terminal processing protease
VAKEIQKLKNAGVTGIIMDLRNNGGGSLSDVVDMAGLFIDQGPIVQVKSADAPPSTLRDVTKGTLYDGPLAIMVNQGSASASEIMAAAMQDYKRAVIVGTPTYGKGTVQKVISLEDFVDPVTRMRMMNEPPIGSLKLTVQKFYRINGGSTQLRGVTPDIKLPDPYGHLDIGERRDKAALKWDEIPAANYQPTNSVNIPFLAASSAKRVAANSTFKLIDQNAAKLNEKEDDDSYPLNEVAYRKELDESAATSKKLEELEKKGTPLAVTNPREDMMHINADSTTVAKNKNWIKNLQKDIYISETVNIINDMAKPAVKVNMGMGMK